MRWPERPLSPPAPRRYRCPQCCQEVWEQVYVDRTGQVFGCDRCLQARAVEEVLPGRCL